MLRIECPYCGVRDEQKFVSGGTSHIMRPNMECGDQENGYLYFRENPSGFHAERWCHSFGCGSGSTSFAIH